MLCRSGRKAYSFGASREVYKNVYIKGSQPRDLTVPGPGSYTLNPFVGNEGRKYTLKPKAKNLSIANNV